MARPRRSFGSIRKLPSGNHQASYPGPDEHRYTAPTTFDSKMDAEAWLLDVKRAISRGEWTPGWGSERPRTVTFGEYASAWLSDRSLKPRTRQHYASLVARQLNPTFENVPVKLITPHQVRAWHSGLGNETPTLRAHAYGLLRTILGQAVRDGELTTNPCHIRGAGNSKRVHKIKPATLAELAALVEAMPAKYRAMVLLAAWCGLRFGELAELRQGDVNLGIGVIHVRRAVVRVDGRFEVGTPKTDAGIRDVSIPPHLLPAIQSHLDQHVGGTKDALLFPAADGKSHLATSTLYRSFYKARAAAGRPDLRFHDLRHTGAVLAASTGATLAELMARLGHSTAGAALRYQHAAQERDRIIAEKLSALVEAPVTPGAPT